MRFRSIEDTVNDLCELPSVDDFAHKKHVEIMKVVARKLERFHIFHNTPYFLSTNLVVSPNYTVELPKDCVKPIKIGKCINGRIRSFYYSADLCSPKDVQPGCTCPQSSVENSDNANGTCAFCSFPNYYSNPCCPSDYTRYSARPYQTVAGYFKPDYEKERIILDPNSHVSPGDEVVLLYKSSAPKVNGKVIIPTEFWEMLEYLIESKYGDKRYRSMNIQKCEMEEQSLVRLYNKMTNEEWEAAFGGYKYSSVKR